MLHRAVFLDRDNTIIENDGYLGDPSKVKLMPGAATALSAIRALGYRLIVVSNQSGVARGMFDEAAVESVNQEMSRQLQEQAGAYVDASYYCPYHPEAPIPEYKLDHEWRKPKPGMLKQAAADFGLELSQCWMIGDQNRDIGAGAAAGCRTILLRDPSKSPATETDSGISVSPSFVVRTLADAARIIAREGRMHANPAPAAATIPASPPVLPTPPSPPAASTGMPSIANPSTQAVATTAVIAAADQAAIAQITDRLARPASPQSPLAASPSLERTLDELVNQMRLQNRNAELVPETNFIDTVAMILQVLAIGAALIGAYAFFGAVATFKEWKDFFLADFSHQAANFWMLVAVLLQGMVIALMLKSRGK